MDARRPAAAPCPPSNESEATHDDSGTRRLGGAADDAATIEEITDRVIERTIRLAETPAPGGAEAARALIVSQWWTDDGLSDVQIDGAGNVWGRLAGTATDRPLVVAAHLDTVFPASDDHAVQRRGERLHGRSVGDNSVAVAAVSQLARLPLTPPPGRALWALATTGEEGLGNLRGALHAFDVGISGTAGADFDAFIALEGNVLGRVGVHGVASARYAIDLVGPGGHAWEHAAVPSAVHEAAVIIAEALANLPLRPGHSTFNVGSFNGGSSVTARAADARLLVDMRSDSDDLHELTTQFEALATRSSAPGITSTITELGRRPGGRIETDHPLVTAATAALTEAGITAEISAMSTDANAAYAAGVPAITLGITIGDLHHSADEWIDLPPITTGITALARTIEHYWDTTSAGPQHPAG